VGGVDLPAGTVAEFVVLALTGLVAFAALGVAIGYAATGDTVQAVVGITFNVLAILGGTWWPVADDGSLMSTIAKLTPSYWANVLARSVITDESLTWGGAAVLVAWTLGLLAFAARRYRADATRA
jgi:ABC-2 type transport system permease protein